MKTRLLIYAVMVLGLISMSAQPTPESKEQFEARMRWFREARFGMFIHWGLYAVPGGEWKGQRIGGAGEWIMETGKIPASEYEQLVPQFNPVQFNARQWARIARGAGMKYLVITSKHHDGFGLWNSKMSDWNVGSTPFKRDILKELAGACRAEKIHFCLYHSIMDWHHPDYTPRRAWNDTAKGEPDFDRYAAYLKGQLKELLTGYGPLGILWFDGEWEKSWTHERGVDLYGYVRGLQPRIIVNNRVGKGRAGMSGMDKGPQRVGDYGTPEQEIPATGFGPGAYWESCMTMNNTWGFRKDDQNWKSTKTLVRNLVDCASKGGNYLLNVGPTAEGLIPEASMERLAAMGKWMKVNSEAIYETSASPFQKLSFDGRCTAKGKTLYLLVFAWPEGGLKLAGLKTPVRKARSLGTGETLTVQTEPANDPSAPKVAVVSKPRELDPLVTVIKLSLASTPEVIALNQSQKKAP